MTEKTVTIPIRVVAMLQTEGYFKEFWRIVQSTGFTHRECWELCEKELFRYGLPEMYSSYESFRVIKHRQGNKGEVGINFW